jgi:antibiotic biosynthesis monooxygenase (ABM) superfamily enzyme
VLAEVKAGGDSRLVVTHSATGSSEEQTKAERQHDRAPRVQGQGAGLSGGPSTPPAGRPAPVTTTVTRPARPGHEAAYEECFEGIISAARRFPGYQGVEVFRPASAGGEYRIVYRFAGAGDLHRWLDSDEHAAWLARAEPHALGPMRTSFLTGLESWFTLPDQPVVPPPPPYKMALLTWATIFP